VSPLRETPFAELSQIAFLRDKSAASVLPAFREIKSQVERESQGLKVVFVRADNGKGSLESNPVMSEER
jgi:hypothetical protein